MRDKGVTVEEYFPYTPGNSGGATLNADWPNRRAMSVGHRSMAGNAAAIKAHIWTRGAVSACLVIYQDFFSYRTGIYRHVTGSQAGGHCVSLIGYDDARRCWIGKEQLGPSPGAPHGHDRPGRTVIAPQATAADTDLGVPRPLTPDDLQVTVSEPGIATTAPVLQPPSATHDAATAIGAWQQDKRITALWSNSSTRNAFMHIAGVGWKRLNPANDSAWSALVLLANQARQTGCRIDYRDEADGLVHEIYLW